MSNSLDAFHSIILKHACSISLMKLHGMILFLMTYSACFCMILRKLWLSAVSEWN